MAGWGPVPRTGRTAHATLRALADVFAAICASVGRAPHRERARMGEVRRPCPPAGAVPAESSALAAPPGPGRLPVGRPRQVDAGKKLRPVGQQVLGGRGWGTGWAGGNSAPPATPATKACRSDFATGQQPAGAGLCDPLEQRRLLAAGGWRVFLCRPAVSGSLPVRRAAPAVASFQQAEGPAAPASFNQRRRKQRKGQTLGGPWAVAGRAIGVDHGLPALCRRLGPMGLAARSARDREARPQNQVAAPGSDRPPFPPGAGLSISLSQARSSSSARGSGGRQGCA